MPVLSELLKARDRLQQLAIDASDVRDAALLKDIKEVCDSLRDLETGKIVRMLQESVDFKSTALRQFQQSQIDRINKLVAKAQFNYKKANRQWCNAIDHYSEEQLKEMVLTHYPNDQQSIDHMKETIYANSNWTDSCLMYQMNEVILEPLKSFYPIYIVDRYKSEVTGKLMKETTGAQMRKIRIYDLDESYHCLPKAGIGLIVSHNHFTHASRYQFDVELKLLVSLLRPGGTLTFNFNDVETSEGALMIESMMRSYQTKTELEQHLRDIGLEVINWTRLTESRTTWVLAKKPGTKTTIKKAEMLGAIIKKSMFIDLPEHKQ